MSELKALKQHYESVVADAQKKLKSIEELMSEEADLAKTGKIIVSKDAPETGVFLRSKEVEKVIMSIEGTFSAKDVRSAIDKAYPGRTHMGKSVIANTLNKLIKEKKLEYVEERSGQSPATYRKNPRKV